MSDDAKLTGEKLREVALATMTDAKFPMLATCDDGQARVRPVSPVRTDGFVVYVANLRSYHKTAELAKEPRMELCYLSPSHDQVRITGVAEVVTERALLEEIWRGNPLLRKYLGSVDNPELVLYRMVPERVRFMREWALHYLEVEGFAGASAAGTARLPRFVDGLGGEGSDK